MNDSKVTLLNDTASIGSKGKNVLSLADEFKAELSNAKENVQEILDNWQDENGKLFEEKYMSVESTFDDCYNNLIEMGNLLNEEATSIETMLEEEEADLQALREA